MKIVAWNFKSLISYIGHILHFIKDQNIYVMFLKETFIEQNSIKIKNF